MTRSRLAVGTFGDISFQQTASGRVQARTRYRDDDGKVRFISAVGETRRAAERRLKEPIATRTKRDAYAELTPDSSFGQLVDAWLEDLDLEGKLAPNTRALYERNMRQLVLPVFEHLALREISTGRVDRFLKKLASTRSHSMAKQAKSVLSLAFGLAVRYDALVRNPIRETARLRKPPRQASALSVEEIEAIRSAVRNASGRIGTIADAVNGVGVREVVNHYDDTSDNPSWVATKTRPDADTAGGNPGRATCEGIDGDLAIIASKDGNAELQISSLHDDIVATVNLAAVTTGLTGYAESTEYGIKRDPAMNLGSQYGWLETKQRSTDSIGGLTLMGARLYNPT